MEKHSIIGSDEQTETSLPTVLCKRWIEFKEKSKGAEYVTLEWTEGQGLTLKALHNGTIYKYVLEAQGLKSWLSYVLDVPEGKVVEGEIHFPWTRRKNV